MPSKNGGISLREMVNTSKRQLSFFSGSLFMGAVFSSYMYYSVNSGFSCKHSVKLVCSLRSIFFFFFGGGGIVQLLSQKNRILKHATLEPSRLVFVHFVRSLF